MKKRGTLEPFGISFLDIISCGFGAVVLLILVFTPQLGSNGGNVTSVEGSDDLPSRVRELMNLRKNLNAEIARIEAQQIVSDAASSSLSNSIEREKQKHEIVENEISKLRRSLNRVTARLENSKQNEINPQAPLPLKNEVAGIPVDRKHIIFVVDTSGSMKEIWPNVAEKMSKILEIHPKVTGFQIMNDNGNYLISGYSKGWIPDSPSMRERALKLFLNWNSPSNSNPHDGIKKALSDYKDFQSDLSIYVLGDEFSGNDFDAVTYEIKKLNSQKARINGLSFTSRGVSANRFGILMREVSIANEGAFLTVF